MNKKEKFSFLKGKGASVGIVLCFVAVIAMVGNPLNNPQNYYDPYKWFPR